MPDNPTPETPAQSASPDADVIGVRPHEAGTPGRVASEPDGPEDGVLVSAPAFTTFEVRNLTITPNGTRVPKSRLSEVRNVAESLGLTLTEH